MLTNVKRNRAATVDGPSNSRVNRRFGSRNGYAGRYRISVSDSEQLRVSVRSGRLNGSFG